MRKSVLASVFFLCLFAPSLAAYSQTTASLQVSVVDQNGDLVLAPTARLIDEKQKSFASRSSAPGQLYFQNIAVGLYRLEITVAGFQPVSYEVKIVSGINRLRIQLKVAERNESVVVSLDPQEKALDEPSAIF
ncbi:MAG: hypothetical protein UZ17_ACD001000053 [Acidobacteria bacterium OLB17]|nr:MAG: hypothetical protein UZ17_ACD001000053 [Acidobacteria bacterium OLB17]